MNALKAARRQSITVKTGGRRRWRATVCWRVEPRTGLNSHTRPPPDLTSSTPPVTAAALGGRPAAADRYTYEEAGGVVVVVVLVGGHTGTW